MRPSYCCFYLHQNLHLGWIRGQAGSSLELVLPDGKGVRQRGSSLLYRWHGEPAAPGEEAALAQLRHKAEALPCFSEALEALSDSLPPGEPHDIEDLAGRVLPSDAGGWERAALFLALLRDNRRFRYGAGGFLARSQAEIRVRTARETEQQARQRWSEKALRWREELEAGRWEASEDPERQSFLAQLRSLMARDKHSPYWGGLAKPLDLIHLHPLDCEARLKRWLEVAGAWQGWPAVWLHWGEVPERFAPELERAAEVLARSPVRKAGRTDFRRQPTFTIDSADTLDCDDAVTILESSRSGMEVVVHIAEPSPVLEPGHLLFEEAAQRLSSVYTLAGTYPMFPERLANDRFSLRAGAERETVSLRFRLEEGGATLLAIERGLVRVERNLAYEQAQRLLEEQPERWGRLSALCAGLTGERIKRGAIVQDRQEVVFDLRDPDRIRMTVLQRNGPVHQLVEELAILHNREAGLYCKANALPAIYRVQPRSKRGEGSWGGPGEFPQSARFSTRGGVHSGLGCERYIQTSSPIRRFPDFVMQRQIIAHVTGAPLPFPNEDRLAAWAERAEGRMATYGEVVRQIESHWKRCYLAQNPGLTLDGVVRQRGETGPEGIWLEPIQLAAECRLHPDLKNGERVRVRVEAVDVDRRSVWVAVQG
jgi:exoribonuclease-2